MARLSGVRTLALHGPFKRPTNAAPGSRDNSRFAASTRAAIFTGIMTLAHLFCSKCGAQNAAAAQFCTRCGALLGGVPPAITTGPLGVIPATSERYGGFWIRLVAFMIDLILKGIIVLPVSLFMFLIIGAAERAVSMPSVGVRLVILIIRGVFSALVSWIYEAALESSPYQATLGKMALGMKVTDLAGNRISFARATGRHFAKYVSGMIFFIGYIMAGFTERKQALHDMIAGTLVQRS